MLQTRNGVRGIDPARLRYIRGKKEVGIWMTDQTYQKWIDLLYDMKKRKWSSDRLMSQMIDLFREHEQEFLGVVF